MLRFDLRRRLVIAVASKFTRRLVQRAGTGSQRFVKDRAFEAGSHPDVIRVSAGTVPARPILDPKRYRSV